MKLLGTAECTIHCLETIGDSKMHLVPEAGACQLHPCCLQVADPTGTDTQWAHRQKELLNRRLYLKDFWYCAGAPPEFADSGSDAPGNN